jgi:uncharacterized protein YqhQ
MADSAVQPNPIDTSSIPLIRGSTYDILCFLGGKIDKRVIKLDSMPNLLLKTLKHLG